MVTLLTVTRCELYAWRKYFRTGWSRGICNSSPSMLHIPGVPKKRKLHHPKGISMLRAHCSCASTWKHFAVRGCVCLTHAMCSTYRVVQGKLFFSNISPPPKSTLYVQRVFSLCRGGGGGGDSSIVYLDGVTPPVRNRHHQQQLQKPQQQQKPQPHHLKSNSQHHQRLLQTIREDEGESR